MFHKKYDIRSFRAGEDYMAYTWLGGQVVNSVTAVFRTYAPEARHVALICEANGWQEIPMMGLGDGVWETTLTPVHVGSMYKYRIYRKDGRVTDHADPLAFAGERPPRNASILWKRGHFPFRDKEWMAKRGSLWQGPVNIYEMHAGSWRRRSGRAGDGYSYTELADKLIPYLEKQGYNFVEFLPLAEHPLDGSWGYQGTGYFCPTARYGLPDQWKSLINRLHMHGIGVIMDFVPVHFAVDAYGLAMYDGTRLFEKPGRSDWGSRYFDHGKGVTRSFLLSAAHYWLSEFHVDAIRVDAVNYLLYQNGRQEQGENAEGIRFLRQLNAMVKAQFPEVRMIAEDPTTYAGCTRPVSEGGLGFDEKWNLGWSYDSLHWLAESFGDRVRDYGKMTFSMDYFYHERHLLALSHDETGRNRSAMLEKPYGTQAQKYDQIRAFYLHMYAHPGKKLTFMGNELGQLTPWKVGQQLNWNLHRWPKTRVFRRFTHDLNMVYRYHPALFERDDRQDGFAWIERYRAADGVIAFLRMAEHEQVLAVLNYSDRPQAQSFDGWGSNWEVLLDTAWDIYGGKKSAQDRWQPGDREIRLDACSGVMLRREL